MTLRPVSVLALAVALVTVPAAAQTAAAPAPAQAERTPGSDGLIFHATLDSGFTAEQAGGDAVPNFRSGITTVADGAIGGAARWSDAGYLAWKAPGNMRAERGTLAFWWRARDPLNDVPFVIFRAGFADHTSWDMAFLRIDWNGHGFDAFVTDANLSRIRVSYTIPQVPDASAWHHLAFAWDETVGVRLYVDGREVAAKRQTADLDSGLDQFGLAGRVISPHQVQSRYNFMRGSDVDDLRVYDRMLPAAGMTALAAKQEPAAPVPEDAAARRTAWLHRYGWDRQTPPVLDDAQTRIRKVEFADARDLKQWMWKGVDGIPETTWPGVYNRSRLPGRDDYFELPDWNVYVEGGKTYDLTVPEGERFNRVTIRGAAYGTLSYAPEGDRYTTLDRRPQGVVHSIASFPQKTGGRLRFTNVMQEQPIQEIWAYDVTAGAPPEGLFSLDYVVDAKASPELPALADLNAYIAGRYAPDEQATAVAMPASGVKTAVGAGSSAESGAAVRRAGARPIVHLLVPSNFGDAFPDKPLARAWDYGWQNLHAGLDGIAIELPALSGKGPIPLDIVVHDPIWPERQMIDVQVSIRPGEARTLWLDLRDRILTNDSLYLTIASAAPEFDADALDGTKLRLVFKDRAEAAKEHVADRFNQVKDNWGFLVEEHTASKNAALYRRLFADISDLLRVDPDHVEARRYWADINYRPENMPAFAQPQPPAGVPLWAFRQLEDLKLVRQFVNWWIDERQVPYGDFGGGISDDTDLTQQWPGLALMGVDPDKINASLRALDDAVYKNGMIVDGLGYLTTDELHAYEEGLNADAERLYLNWGEPRTVERIMATTKALGGIVTRNPAGHLHFSSNWYGGRKVYREGAFEWQKPYSFTVLHGPILLGLYNANPAARGLVTGVIDGWMAHGTQNADGSWSYPNEINWRSDATRVGDGGGATTPLQSAWAAWRFTGEARYLRPIETRIATAGLSALAEFNENAFAALPMGDQLLATAPARAEATGDPFALYGAWTATGDRGWLERLHADAIADKAQHQYMYTEGHWWSDRVDQPNEILQRERLGGIALRRNQTWPGNTVSWRFADPDAATQVAILVRDPRPDAFRVVAYNTSDRPQRATMTGWSVDPGRWTMKAATSSDGGTTLAPGETRQLTLERSASTEVVFAPGTTTVLDFALDQPGSPVAQRPDLGIGTDDVAVQGRRVTVTVHSLGALPAEGGVATLVDGDGRERARAAVPALAAPTDLTPKTATVRLTVPAGVDPSTLSVRVALPGDAAEVTRRNNQVPLAGLAGR
ncbi:LamG-like jellyroll fold domain-containing protein [Sphingomonas sp. ac-8]|uniref:LamG-like jellyroll fold domain-containing protein n=1 Tax=Sphingomonas sp. ac-8 TaxID=3242977 RepID=UPI003A801997